MKKMIPIIVIGILIVSGFGASALYADKNKQKTETMNISFSSPIVKEKDNNYMEIFLDDSTHYLMSPGRPVVPKIVRTVELPFGVQNVKVNVIPKTVHEYGIEKDIYPAPAFVPLTDGPSINVEPRENIKVYTSSEIFPSSWYNYRVGCGLNSVNKLVTHIPISIFPVRYAPALNRLYVMDSAKITITYEDADTALFPENGKYDMVVIAPSKFSKDLQRLVEHKNSIGISTTLNTTEEIYDKYDGTDKPEKIKYFIKYAKEEWNITYVLLVGGLKSLIWAIPRDDENQGAKHWHVPVRYTNLFDNPKYPLSDGSSLHDPGFLSDLYYADIYKEGGAFEDWDSNDDGIFAAWGRPGVENDTNLDLYPDVIVGRLACRNNREVKTVVDKIINYEKDECDPSWFKRMIVVSGDGFLDQEDLDIQWDVNALPDGEYTIYAQSRNPDDVYGPIDVINVTLDQSIASNISFNHDDHLQIDNYPNFPYSPIAEIVSVSEGDILGNTDYHYTPSEGEAYCNSFNPWANISYENGILHIRGKSYDPKPYGNVTDIHVWIENDDDQIIFSEWRNGTEIYYEGEWTTGEKALFGRGGALYYMPEDFERVIIWASNGNVTGMDDVIESLSQGSGFAFLSGHGSPNVWADHFPGVPGNRAHGSFGGLRVSNIKIWPKFVNFPVFPMNKLSNIDKPPVTVIGGCHNSMFDVSAIPTVLNALPNFQLFEFLPKNNMWTYGALVPECFSWYLIRLPNRGAIATMGNTGLGYGMPGKACTSGGGDSWITIEFFKQYGAEGHEILGEAYAQTLSTYINTFDMEDLGAGHQKTVQQWVLLGDPSLKIGGYS